MENKRKKCLRIEYDISNGELFAVVDGIDSGGESDVDSILNESGTEFVSDKPINKTVYDTNDILVPEANVHVASELTVPQQEDCEVFRKKRICQIICDIKWNSRKTCHPRRDCTQQAYVPHKFGENFTQVDVFMKVVNTQELIDHIAPETDIYAAQKGRNFLTNYDGLKAFLGINYLRGINKLPSVANYWEVDHYIGNDGIKNVMTRQRFQDILQNLPFASNDYDDKSDKSRALCVMFGNIHYIVPSKLTSLIAKI